MTREFLDAMIDDVRDRFYAEAEPRTFYAQRRQLVRALTWPAIWWRRRGFRTEITPENYRRVITSVLDGIGKHGDAAKIKSGTMGASGFFPAYLLKCIQDHYQYHGESLYETAKPLRDTVHSGDTLGDCIDIDRLVLDMRSRQKATVPAKPKVVLDLEELAKAAQLIGPPKKKKKQLSTEEFLF